MNTSPTCLHFIDPDQQKIRERFSERFKGEHLPCATPGCTQGWNKPDIIFEIMERRPNFFPSGPSVRVSHRRIEFLRGNAVLQTKAGHAFKVWLWRPGRGAEWLK